MCVCVCVCGTQVDLYMRLVSTSYRECIWDHAPGSLLVKEAGGIVTDATGKALDFSLGRHLTGNAGVLASNGVAHAAILAAAASALEDGKL